MKLGRKGSKIEVKYFLPFYPFIYPFSVKIVEIDLIINLEDMHLEMECLFPR